MEEGERTVYSVPLSGESPSLTFSWEDGLGQAGAVTFKDEQIPYPLPSVEGELCRLSVASLGWTPGSVSGVIASECVSAIEEAVSLQTAAGHKSVTETALMEAEVTAITGTVSVAVGGSRTSASFVPTAGHASPSPSQPARRSTAWQSRRSLRRRSESPCRR